ncbi:DUF4446 family protein [uncultured Clostridium sp.]|uniref:DUF4446 family protein n=1 Tax=uncultured Clostridium sp. TaxID=59620 RepID=UPI0028E8468E|nr:DUF4446 family protein [uncultured Clostridium sp.]
MESLINLISEYQPILLIIGLCLIIILFLIIIIQFSAINKLEKRYRKFMRGVDIKNIEEMVVSYLDKVDNVTEQIDKLKTVSKEIDIKLNNCIQKTSIVRYRAFENVGSDLSYSIVLLDNKNDGIILTGIYGRDDSTTYAKPIDKGLSRYELSEEEKYVLKDAMSKSI